jgi:hypothetical protein
MGPVGADAGRVRTTSTHVRADMKKKLLKKKIPVRVDAENKNIF